MENLEILQHFSVLSICIMATACRCDGAKAIRETNYFLGQVDYHSRWINPTGRKTEIGSSIPRGRVIGEKEDVYSCFRSDDEKYYKDKYLFEERAFMDYMKPVPKEPRFIYIAREFWICRTSDLKSQTFVRIVNEVIFKGPISYLRFNDGMEVTTRNYEDPDIVSVRVREIKYSTRIPIAGESKRMYHKFAGSLILLEYDPAKFSFPNAKSHIHQQETSIVTPEDKFPSVKVSGKGKTLRIGRSVLTENKGSSEQEKMICRLGADVSLYSPILLPSIEEAVPESGLFAKLNKKDFIEQFVVIKREIYLCTPEQPDGSRAILRVVNDVIGTIPIKEVFYSQKIVYLSVISLKEDGATARFKEIKYLNIGDETWSEEVYSNFEIMDEKYHHSTLTKDDSKDIEYLLTPMSVFKTFIAQEGYELRIGETYTHQIGNEMSSVKCYKKHVQYVNDFRTVVKMKLNNGVLHSLVPIQNDSIYKVLTQEVLLCTDKESAPTIKFLRIVNRIEFTVPVQKIETYDGVDIVGKMLTTYHNKLGIIEKKYLDYITHKPVKYVGNILLTVEQAVKPREFPIISKTIDDITSVFGYTAEILPSLTDVNARSCLKTRTEGPKMKLAKEGVDLIFVEPEFDPKKCDDLKKVILSNDTALCEKVNNDHNAIIPNFLISDGNGKKEPVKESNLDEYFVTVKNDVFQCTNQHKESKQPEKFLRVVTSKRLSTSRKVKEISNYLKGSIRLEMENNYCKLFYEDVRYLQDKNTPILTSFIGFITFPDKEPGRLKSGTESIVLNQDLLRKHIGHGRMKYKENLYTILINEDGDGDSLELGSKWQNIISAEEIACQLRKGANEKKKEAFDTRIVIRNGKKRSGFHDFFGDLKQEVWDCTDMSGRNVMLRVVNQFKVKLGKMNAIKEIHYYDGLSIILGEIDKKNRLEITEVKYLMPEKLKVVKYEGEVYLSRDNAKDDGKNWLTFKESELEDRARIDFHHTLQENELRRKELNNLGDILEIGQKFYRHETTYLKRLICEIQPTQPGMKALRPRVVIYKNKGDTFFPVAMDDVEFSDYFTLTTRVWTCNGIHEKFYRVENILKEKRSETENGVNAISHVYYRDGITVIPGEGVTVEEVKYVSKLGADYETIKFDGFMRFKGMNGKEGTPKFIDGSVLVNEMNNYFLDEYITQVAGPYGCGLDDCDQSKSMGAIYEVGSPWETEIEVTDEVMICEEDLSDSRLNLEMQIQGIIVENNVKFWKVLRKTSKYYRGISQQVWICKRAKDDPIHKVRYSMIVTKELARIYHTDGVSVNWLELPDSSRYVEIVVDALLEPVTNEVLKYDGEFRFQAQSGLRTRQRFFPLDYKQQLLLEPQSTTDRNHYLSMDDAVVLVRTAQDWGKGELSKEERSSMLFMHVTKNGTRTLRLGTDEGEVYSPARPPVCTLHAWNLNLRTKYIPKLVEYYDDRLYELDEETFHFFFNIIEQNVWLCASKQEAFFRIVTKFKLLHKHKTVGGIKVTALHGSVVPTLKVKSKEPDYFTETVFINAETDKHLKYAGKWYEFSIKEYIGRFKNGLKGKGRTFGSGKHPIKKIPPV